MKLVDILARKIIWPEGLECLSQLQHNGSIINGKGFDGRVWAWLEIAEDTPPAGVIVTKAEWQAAVDAMRTEYPAELDGEGLPPIGTKCEFKSVGHHSDPEYQWCVYHGKMSCGGYIVEYHHHTSPSMVTCAPFDPALTTFRPIRTPEQIAAEEIQKIRDEIRWQKPQIGPCPVEQMYLLGYRKFEIVDN